MSSVRLTLFTAPKPMTNPHVAVIQHNAFASWQQLGEAVQVVVVGMEEGLLAACNEFGFTYLPEVERNHQGTPLVSSIFSTARGVNQSPLLAYVNADIILLPGFVEEIERVAHRFGKFLVVGQRYDLDIDEVLEFEAGWQDALLEKARSEGKLHARTGSDYFAFPRTCFDQIPEFSIGRAGWDNWMIYRARKMRWPVVDASASIPIVHQNHDYSHLPGGQAHYRLPESNENLRLAGGRRTIFELDDATHVLTPEGVGAFPSSFKKALRNLEVAPLLKLHAYGMTQALFTLFHPIRAAKERKRERAEREARRASGRIT